MRSSVLRAGLRRITRRLGVTRFDPPYITYDYTTLAQGALTTPLPSYMRYPCVTPRWDNSPRRKAGAVVLTGSHPSVYRDWVADTLARSDPDLLFVNAWNEWGEGAHLEPCEHWGRAYLEAHRDAVRGASIPAAS
jgi:hypothetical protein